MGKRVLNTKEFAELASGLLASGTTVCLQAYGQSMFPFIRDGDMVHIEPVGPDTPKLHDVVIFQGPGNRTVLHRVIRKDVHSGGVTLTTRGDGVMRASERVDAARVLGWVSGVERRGRVVSFDRPLARLLVRLWVYAYPIRYLVRGIVRRIRGRSRSGS